MLTSAETTWLSAISTPDSGANAALPPSAIRSFFASRDYALAAQARFSSNYVDRHGFTATGRNGGFRLDQTQFSALAI